MKESVRPRGVWVSSQYSRPGRGKKVRVGLGHSQGQEWKPERRSRESKLLPQHQHLGFRGTPRECLLCARHRSRWILKSGAFANMSERALATCQVLAK